MPQKNSYILEEQHVFSPNTTTVLVLPKREYTTRLDCLVCLNVTATSAASPKEDHWGRIIKDSRLATSTDNYLDVPDGRQWFWWNRAIYKNQLKNDPLPLPNTTADIYSLFRLQLGFDPMNRFDRTVVIPALRLSNLRHQVTWGSDQSLGTGYTINSGNIKLTTYGLDLKGEKESTIWPVGLIIPRLESHIIDINSHPFDNLPIGDTLYQTIIMALNSADNRSDKEIKKVGFEFPENKRKTKNINWRSLKLAKGVAMFSWEKVSGIPIGLDLSSTFENVQLRFAPLKTGGRLHLLHILYS